MDLGNDPEIDSAVLQQMAYASNFTKNINTQMRVPETITVENGQTNDEGQHVFHPPADVQLNLGLQNPSVQMEIPDKIVVSVGEGGLRYNQGQSIIPTTYDVDYVEGQVVPLKTPPRVLTLQDRNLDSLDINNPNFDDSKADQSSFVSNGLAQQQFDIENEDLDEVSLMRKQVFKLHKRLASLEQQHNDQVRKDYIVYGISAVFWLLNGWFLYSHRRLY